jgi:hypothetical protein
LDDAYIPLPPSKGDLENIAPSKGDLENIAPFNGELRWLFKILGDPL